MIFSTQYKKDRIRRKNTWILPLILSLLLLPIVSNASEKEYKPRWEVGLAIGLTSLPHYVGSDEKYILPLGVPYLIYRGNIMQADEHGLRGRLFESENLSMDLDFSFGLPVRNNGAREGMQDLELTGQIGPQLNWTWFKNQHSDVGFHLPWRLASDIRMKYLGWLLEPGVRLIHDLDKKGDYTLHIEGEVLYASEGYNQYYYGISPQYRTPTRTSYNAKQGLHSISLKTALSIRHNDNIYSGIYIRAKTLAPSVIADSPLVKNKYYLSIGIGMIWTFMTSKETVLW